MLHILDINPGPNTRASHRRDGGRKKWERERESVCQEAHSFCWAPSGSGKVDKQWRELHPISSLKPEQTHARHNASPPILCHVPSIVTDWVLSIVGQILSRSVRQTKAEGKRTKKKNRWKLQATMRKTNEMMAESHPSTQLRPTAFNLVKPAQNHSNLLQWADRRNQTVNPTLKGSYCWIKWVDIRVRSTVPPRLYGRALFKKAHLHSFSLWDELGGNVSCCSSWFGIPCHLFRPFWHALYYSRVGIFIIPYGDIVLVESQT